MTSRCDAPGQLGVAVTYRDGKAAVGESFEQPEFNDDPGAPKAIADAIKAGAQYVGLRDDQRKKGRTPDWDILIFASENDAKSAYLPLSNEVGDPVGAVQSGRFVTVVLPDAEANGDNPQADEAKLADCQQQAENA